MVRKVISAIGRGLGWAAWFIAEAMHRVLPWWRWPRWIGMAMLMAMRGRLRRENLFDVEALGPGRTAIPPHPCLAFRSTDGSYNDLVRPTAGKEGTRFGRNVRPTQQPSEAAVTEPNPRDVSELLMKRDTFQAFEHGNALMAAWIQFMIRDWFNHGATIDQRWGPFPAPDGAPNPDPLFISGIQADRRGPTPAGEITHVNVLTHWWDGSQLYPADQELARRSRCADPDRPWCHDLLPDGNIRDDLMQLLPEPANLSKDPETVPGFWVGLGMMMSLFAKEHNAICAALKEQEHIEDPEVLYATARLVNTALMTRIHTLDWTAAVLGHKTTRWGTEFEWWGLLGKKSFDKRGKRRWRSELLCGIPGSRTKDSGVPFSLTEEFVAVYRMHNMLPDRFEHRGADGAALGEHDELHELLGPKALAVLKRDPAALLQTFGHATAGVVSLRNFPLALRTMNVDNDDAGRRDLDLAAVDILRCRELGVPRYNDLRKGLHMAPKRSIEELTSDDELRTAIHHLYKDIDDVDLLVGLYAEDRPTNCIFSDTTFRIFLLMAPRRLLSDRFFTDDYDVEHYTRTGIDWVENNRLKQVLTRHHDELEPILRDLDNAFHPWGQPKPW